MRPGSGLSPSIAPAILCCRVLRGSSGCGPLYVWSFGPGPVHLRAAQPRHCCAAHVALAGGHTLSQSTIWEHTTVSLLGVGCTATRQGHHRHSTRALQVDILRPLEAGFIHHFNSIASYKNMLFTLGPVNSGVSFSCDRGPCSHALEPTEKKLDPDVAQPQHES